VFIPKIENIKKFDDNQQLLSILQNATVTDAAKIMSDNQIGCIAVFDRNKFVGILSERDVLSKVLASSLSPDKIKVSEVMTSSVISCSANTTLVEAERLMAKHRIRHLPIIKAGKAIGMISTRDLIAYRLKSNKAMQTAAEQLAMLPTGLKSLEFKDVISLAINDVPKNFNFENAVLCLAPRANSRPVISCNNCRMSHQKLIENAQSGNMPQLPQITNKPYCPGRKNADEPVIKLVIPLKIHDQCADDQSNHVIPGLLCMCRHAEPDGQPDPSQLYKASLLQQVLDVNLTNAMLYKNYQDARKNSETDPLTGVGTRRVLENVLKAECARASRYHKIFSIAIVDLYHFKKINDDAGHAAGDRTLKNFARFMHKNTRETDVIIARYGGDEFVLVMPETKIEGAKILLERIRRQFSNISTSAVSHPTISCGIAQCITCPPDTPKTIMARADRALYRAKRNGRNQVVIHQNEMAAV